MPKIFLLATSPYSPLILELLLVCTPRWYEVRSTGLQQLGRWQYYLVGEVS